jgi:DNA mismatch repair protein MutS
VFLHRLMPGGANRSYGIHVAQLAGIPKAVINRANEILEELEAAGSDFRLEKREKPEGTVQLSFFQTDPDPVVKALKALKIDEMTPLDALTKLYELKRLVDED